MTKVEEVFGQGCNIEAVMKAITQLDEEDEICRHCGQPIIITKGQRDDVHN